AGLRTRRAAAPSPPDRVVRAPKSEFSELRAAPPQCESGANGVQWLRVPGWESLEWLCHGFSTRIGGSSNAYCGENGQGELNLGFTAEDERATVIGNRALLAEAITGSVETPLATIRQIHSDIVVVAGRADAGDKVPRKADGLMTDEPGLLLAVQTADCIPVLVADRKRRAVAAFHAGWRGTVKRIVEGGIGRMRLEFGSRPEDLVAAVGPGIGLCCYAVGEEVLSAFESQFAYARELFLEVEDRDPVRARYPTMFLNQRAPGHAPNAPSLHLNLAEANRRQLLAAGLKPRSIRFAGGCTSCRPDLFFSHRASGGRAGRMMSVIGVRPAC
ncbi:MAG: peptidoglycan editing factor PgeF, partial [Terracidiphilus sp.]